MKIKVILTSMGVVFPMLFCYAQYDADALRYSTYDVSGSARYQGIGDAQTALGADIGSLSGNPAGLGFFRKSELSISAGLGYLSTNTTTNIDYNGQSTDDDKLNFNIPNFGIVFSGAKSDVKGGKWRGGSFGISYSRVSSFQNRFSYSGVNNGSSYADYVVEQAKGIHADDLQDAINNNDHKPSDFIEQAYQTFLINPYTDDPSYYYRFNDTANNMPFVPIRQQETFNTKGAQYQWNFSYGGNYNDKLYFGASLGITRLRYEYQKDYQETFQYPSNYSGTKIFNNYLLTDNLDVSGTGFNLSVGVIYRPNDILRLGASITSPTFYSISEEFNSTLTPHFNKVFVDDGSGGQYDLSTLDPSSTIPNTFAYTLRTPMKASGGVAFFFGKAGFLSADVEYIPYNTMRLSTDGNADFKDYYNGEIKSIYQGVVNIKTGVEFRSGIFRYRGGFAYQEDPYKERFDGLNRTRLAFSLGAGIRLTNYYFDLAAVHSRSKNGYSPYTFANGEYPSATIQNANTNVVFTFGTFF